MKTVLLLSLVLSGCGGIGIGDEYDWCDDMRCDPAPVTFAPEPQLEQDVAEALGRLRAATGRADLGIDPSGVPVVHREALRSMHDDGKVGEDCGQTLLAYEDDLPEHRAAQWVAVDPTPPDGCLWQRDSVLHELIHALAPRAEHSATGVFHKSSGGRVLDSASLEALCGEFECLEFTPETH